MRVTGTRWCMLPYPGIDSSGIDSLYCVAMSKISTPESVTQPFARTPLTGRDTEFSLLKDRWELAQEGMGQVVLVVGQPGLAKSRLVQTLTERVQADPSEEAVAAGEELAGRYVDQPSSVIEWRCSQHF